MANFWPLGHVGPVSEPRHFLLVRGQFWLVALRRCLIGDSSWLLKQTEIHAGPVVLREVSLIRSKEGSVAEPHPSPILYLPHSFWLYPAPFLPQRCVCFGVCVCVCCVNGGERKKQNKNWAERLVCIFSPSKSRRVNVFGRKGGAWVEWGGGFDSCTVIFFNVFLFVFFGGRGWGDLTKHSIISKLMWKTWNGGQ